MFGRPGSIVARIVCLRMGENVTDAAGLSAFVTVRSLTSDMFMYCDRRRSVAVLAHGVSRGVH